MKLSVALCTYNALPYLSELLESLVHQTRQPDELVVCDDQSTDQTVLCLQQFAARSPFPVRITQNQTRLRSTRNFAQAIEQCEGDFIFLCDQDDVWFPEKLESLETALKATSAGYVFSDAVRTTSELVPLDQRLWQSLSFDKHRQAQFIKHGGFDLLLKKNLVTGATMAFDSRFRDLLLPIPESWVHDAWISLLISAVDSGTLVSRPLIHYRQHASQQIGQQSRSLWQQYQAARKMDREYFQRNVDNFEAALQRLQLTSVYTVSTDRHHSLRARIEHWRTRVTMREKSLRIFTIIRELLAGNYTRYSLGWKSVLQDLFL